ncbi:membrane protein [Staphylococcus phage Metroid]|nr:membrane protein [Staphylococcus phage Metroid]
MLTPILITVLLIIIFSFLLPIIFCSIDDWSNYFMYALMSFILLTISALPNILLWTGVI